MTEYHIGLYACFIRKPKDQIVILDFFSLVLYESHISVKKGKQADLACSANILKSISPSLVFHRVWYKNNRVIENRSLEWQSWIEPEAKIIDSFRINRVSKEDAGIYKCLVFDMTSTIRRNWTLNFIELVVVDSKPFNSFFLDDRFRLFIRVSAVLIVLVSVIKFLFNLLYFFCCKKRIKK